MLRTVSDALRTAVRMASSTLVELLPTTSVSRYTWLLIAASCQRRRGTGPGTSTAPARGLHDHAGAGCARNAPGGPGQTANARNVWRAGSPEGSRGAARAQHGAAVPVPQPDVQDVWFRVRRALRRTPRGSRQQGRRAATPRWPGP